MYMIIIIEIFTDKIGLISEDEFSKSIIQIQEIKSTLSLANTDFIININYEKREMKRGKRNKNYYLLFINIWIKENKHLALNKYENEHFNTKIDKENSKSRFFFSNFKKWNW